MAETKTMTTTEKTVEKTETDLQPYPTQEMLDEASGGKDRKVEKRDTKQPEELPPTPTQKENDEYKAALFPGAAAQEKAARDARGDNDKIIRGGNAVKEVEDATLPPTPTQEEHDQFKKDVMYDPEEAPGGELNPQKKKTNKTVEASQPGGTYSTRTMTPAPAPAPAHAPAPDAKE